jgi:ribosomal protein S18 acetylase RimI-like enzyme
MAKGLLDDEELRRFNAQQVDQPWYARALPMEGRATFLPFRDTMPGSVFNQRELAVPGLLAEAANAITAPARSLLGTDPEFSAGKEGVNMAMNVMGGGVGTSKAMRNPTGQGGVDLAMAADFSYRGSHTAPDASVYGATLDNLTGIMPKDVYTQQGKSLYGLGNRAVDHEWYMAALKAKGNPDAEVTVYRAVPKGVKDINSGDWVTTSKTYAKDHGENYIGEGYEIISKNVKAKSLSTEGYPYEFGYKDLNENLGNVGLLGSGSSKDVPIITKTDASEIYGKGSERVKYTDPASGGYIDILAKPDGTASVVSLEVPKEFRGTGIGKSLQDQAMTDFPALQGQVSSKAAATNAYRLGRRPVGKPNATLEDVLKMIDEDSSVNLITSKMQEMLGY